MSGCIDLAYLSFLDVFYSEEVVQYLNIDDISIFRQICKYARETKITLSWSVVYYTKLQILNIIPKDTHHYEILPKTFVEFRENEMNRYEELFKYPLFGDFGINFLVFHKDTCISEKEEKYLREIGKTHYFHFIYDTDKGHYMWTNKEFNRYEFILAFSSQEEVLYFFMNLIECVSQTKRWYYDCDDDEFNDLINAIDQVDRELEYDCIYKINVSDNFYEPIERISNTDGLEKRTDIYGVPANINRFI